MQQEPKIPNEPDPLRFMQTWTCKTCSVTIRTFQSPDGLRSLVLRHRCNREKVKEVQDGFSIL